MKCVITAVPDEIRGQIVKATVVLTRVYAPSDTWWRNAGPCQIIDSSIGTCPRPANFRFDFLSPTGSEKYPRILVFLPELPKTISGKIRRVEIREKDQESKGAET